MDKKILEYARKYIERQISFIESDLILDIYSIEATTRFKEHLAKWELELAELNELIKD